MGWSISISIIIFLDVLEASVECKESDIVFTSNFGTEINSLSLLNYLEHSLCVGQKYFKVGWYVKE